MTTVRTGDPGRHPSLPPCCCLDDLATLHDGLCCPSCGPLTRMPTKAIQLVGEFVKGAAFLESLHIMNGPGIGLSELPPHPDPDAEAVMATCPPFRIKRAKSGDVHLVVDYRRVYLWKAQDLQVHAVRERVKLLDDLLHDGATWETLEMTGGVTKADYLALKAQLASLN